MSMKLNAMVAERVMGWPRVGIEEFRRPYVKVFPDGSTNVYTEGNNHWSPSTEISAAWEAAKKMGKTHRYELSCNIGYFPSVSFIGSTTGQAEAESEQLAICLAALRAVGVPESEITASMEET